MRSRRSLTRASCCALMQQQPLTSQSVVRCIIGWRAASTRRGLAMMPPGHGPPLNTGSASAVRERRQAKEITRRAVEEQDVPMAVYGWLELSVCHSASIA